MVACNKKIPTGGNEKGNSDNYGAVSSGFYTQKQTNYPRQTLNFKHDKSKLHSTQKPVDLLEYLISTYTKEKETVLDFTMGSGSTGVACVNTDRKFIGIEMDDVYFKVATDRVKKRQKEVAMDITKW